MVGSEFRPIAGMLERNGPGFLIAKVGFLDSGATLTVSTVRLGFCERCKKTEAGLDLAYAAILAGCRG